MKKLIKLFKPTYAIICNQGTSFNEWVCMTEDEIIELYANNYVNNDFAEEDLDNVESWLSLEWIAELYEVIIFKSKKSVEDMSSKEWDKAIKKNDIFGYNIYESIRVYQKGKQWKN